MKTQNKKHKEAQMDFSTKLAQEGVEQLATLLSDMVVRYVEEEERVSLDEIELGMRQIMQEVGRQALGQVLEKSDQVEPSIRCSCKYRADYRCRREGMVISVFGRVQYKRSYYVCAYCRRGEKPLDKRLHKRRLMKRLSWPKSFCYSTSVTTVFVRLFDGWAKNSRRASRNGRSSATGTIT
jgi:hypothetical protein